MGWGTSGWGVSSWGLGPSVGFVINSVLVTSERSFVVELSEPPMQSSTVTVGDALNPRTWHVTRQDTGEQMLVLAVRLYSLSNYFELYLLDKLASSLITHRVDAPLLLNQLGSPIGPPTYFDFLGCQALVIPPADRGFVDVANPQVSDGEYAGALQVGSDGDYANESGPALYRKLIIRRIITTPGDFFHFSPTYGLGVRMKEPFIINDLAKLKAALENQLLEEPEFAAVRASISLKPDGQMVINVQVQLRKTNELFSIPIQVPTSLVAL